MTYVVVVVGVRKNKRSQPFVIVDSFTARFNMHNIIVKDGTVSKRPMKRKFEK